MKIDRLVGIITILLRQGKTTAPELAARFEVSRRTINRDIEILCQAGIPLITVQGYGGGISIAEGYQIEKSLFTQEELEMIFEGIQGMSTVISLNRAQSIWDKLSIQKKQAIDQDYIVIDLASHYGDSLPKKIETIKLAIKNHERIIFSYYYEKGNEIRQIEPYKILFQWSCWYVFGFCISKQDFRTFKLNRLWELENTRELFEPREIHPCQYSFQEYFSQDNFLLKAIFRREAQYRLIDEYGLDCFTVLEDETIFFKRHFASYEIMKTWILSFGSLVKVVEPVALKRDLIEQAKSILNDYEK